MRRIGRKRKRRETAPIESTTSPAGDGRCHLRRHHWKTWSILATELPEATISIVSYPPGPSSPAPVTFPHLLQLYRTLVSDAKKNAVALTLAGGSAGGKILLALTIEALRQDPKLRMPRPRSLLAICPAVDLTHQNPQHSVVEPRDPVLRLSTIKSTAKEWAGDWPTEDPRVSPTFADVGLLQRAGVIVHGVTGACDILGADAVLFREKCERVGIEGEWLDWAKQMHCWPLASSYKIMPESTQAWKMGCGPFGTEVLRRMKVILNRQQGPM